MLGIPAVNNKPDSSSYTVTKNSDLCRHGEQKFHVMWLDAGELNAVQKCKLEQPIRVAGLEQFGSQQANPKASFGASCF